MSNYDAKDAAVRQRQLDAQELVVTADDANLYSPNGGNGQIDIGEDVEKVWTVLVIDDSVPSAVPVAAANISISGSVITVTGLALAANDVAIVKYKVAE